MNKVKKKLVLSGSGTKFPVFAGAIKRLEEEGIEFDAVIGTSGGSIIATAVASGYTGTGLIDLCKEIVPRLSSLVDFSILRPVTEWGFIKKDKIKTELDKHLIRKMGEAQIPLYITATNFDTSELEIFSSEEHPELDAARVQSASITIPVVFVPEYINGDLFIDGGVKKNFAIDFFGKEEKIIGLHFTDEQKRRPRPKGIKGLFGFIARVIGLLIDAKTEDDIEDAPHAISIRLTTKVSGLDFSFSPKQIDEMIKEGYDCVDQWIKENPNKIRE